MPKNDERNWDEMAHSFYAALWMQAQGRWASVEEIRSSLMYDEPKLESYLDGCIHLRELEKKIFDDGSPYYMLTKTGINFAWMNTL